MATTFRVFPSELHSCEVGHIAHLDYLALVQKFTTHKLLLEVVRPQQPCQGDDVHPLLGVGAV